MAVFFNVLLYSLIVQLAPEPQAKMEAFDFFPLLIIGIFIFCYLVKILSEALEARKARLKREYVANGGATGKRHDF